MPKIRLQRASSLPQLYSTVVLQDVRSTCYMCMPLMLQAVPGLAKFLHEFVDTVYQPGYSDWEVMINAGSTDAWSKIVPLLLNKGDGILCEEWTYPSALSTAWPAGFRPVPLPMDGQGMTALVLIFLHFSS